MTGIQMFDRIKMIALSEPYTVNLVLTLLAQYKGNKSVLLSCNRP